MLLKSAFAAVSLLAAAVSGSVVSYTRPSIYAKSSHFALTVNGTAIQTVSYDRYDYAQWSMSEGSSTQIRISALGQGSISSYSITPRSLPIKATVKGNELVFSMKKAHYLIIKINDLKEFVVMSDPLESNVPKVGAAGVINAASYGTANSTGTSPTKGIQAALDAAGKKPGSTVYVGPGLYYIGNLLIPTKTSLYLAGGAVLRFTGRKDHYKVMYKKSDLYEGTWWISTAHDSTDIKLFGRGTIDGNGHYTRSKKFMASMVVPAGTKNFKMDGVLVRDSSFWAVNVVQVEHSSFTNLKILDRFDVSQDDGIDINESSHVQVRRVISIANDDSFSAKTWPKDVGTTVPYPYPPRGSTDVTFDDCLAWTLCWAYKVGEGSWQDQSNIVFKNSAVYRAGVGIGIHHKFGSAAIRNVTWFNIDVEQLHGAPAGQAAWGTFYVNNVNQGIGHIQNLKIRDIKATRAGSKKGLIQGQSANAKISGVTFTDIVIAGKKATSLKDLNMNTTKFYENIKVQNT
ncbi:pectin lyase-like protein [Auricularia subglabra TFB-10046 SS5]|nr:pectin lyase-like protein [Auricularia subglabra TFB-10046 SS5]